MPKKLTLAEIEAAAKQLQTDQQIAQTLNLKPPVQGQVQPKPSEKLHQAGAVTRSKSKVIKKSPAKKKKERRTPKYPEDWEIVPFNTKSNKLGRYTQEIKGEKWAVKKSFKFYSDSSVDEAPVQKSQESSGDEAPEQEPAPKKKKIKKLLNVEVPYSEQEQADFEKTFMAYRDHHRKIQKELKIIVEGEKDPFVVLKSAEMRAHIHKLHSKYTNVKTPYTSEHLKADIAEYVQKGFYVPCPKDDIRTFQLNLNKKRMEQTDIQYNVMMEDDQDIQLSVVQSIRPESLQPNSAFRYLVRGGFDWKQKPDAYKKIVDYSALGVPFHAPKELPPCNQLLHDHIDRISKFANIQQVHIPTYPLEINDHDGRIYLPLVVQDVPLKYKNMDDMTSGILGLPREFWMVKDMHIRAYIIKRRYERFFSQTLKAKLASSVLQTNKFNPFLYKLVALTHFCFMIKHACSHFQPNQIDTRMYDFPRYRSGMAHLDQNHAKQYIPMMDDVKKVLLSGDGWRMKRIELFSPDDLGFQQILAANGPNKQYCHDMCQKSTDMPSRVPQLTVSVLCQGHFQNMSQALECMPLTSQAWFLHLVASSPITKKVEHLQPILAACVGPDSIEARHYKGIPIMSYGKYSITRTYENEDRDVRFKLPEKGCKPMLSQHISKFFYKEIGDHEGVVKLVPIYAFDLALMKKRFPDKDEPYLFLYMKKELIDIILELQVNCPELDSLIFESCFTRDLKYENVVCYQDVGVEAQYSIKPTKDTRFNQSYNCKLYQDVQEDGTFYYDLKFRLGTTGTLTELQQEANVFTSPDDLIFSSGNGCFGLDQEKEYVSVFSFDQFRALHSQPVVEGDNNQVLNLNIKATQKSYKYMKEWKGAQVYVLALHRGEVEECAKAQMLGSIITNEECRHLSHSRKNMVKLSELAIALQQPEDEMCEYPTELQQVTPIPLTKWPVDVFVTLVNDANLDNIKNLSQDELAKFYNELTQVQDMYKANKNQKNKPYTYKIGKVFNGIIQKASGNEKAQAGSFKDHQGQTISATVMAHMIEISEAKNSRNVTDPNLLISTTIKNSIKSLTEADHLENENGVMLYWMELLRASLNCDIAFSMVLAQWPTLFHPDQIRQGAGEQHVRLSLLTPFFLVKFRDMFKREELIQDVDIIFTSIPDAHMFMVRAAFTLFLNVRDEGMSVNTITRLYINTLSLFNWFEYLGFFFLVIPSYAQTLDQQNAFINQSIWQLKAWALYQIYTVLVRLRPLFLKELDKMLALRIDIQNFVKTEDASFYQAFILQSLVKQDNDFLSFDTALPFQDFPRTDETLKQLGLKFYDPTKPFNLTETFEIFDKFGLSHGDNGITENREVGMIFQKLYQTQAYTKALTGGVHSITFSEQPEKHPFVKIYDYAAPVVVKKQSPQQMIQASGYTSPVVQEVAEGVVVQTYGVVVEDKQQPTKITKAFLGQNLDQAKKRLAKQDLKKQEALVKMQNSKPKTPVQLQTESQKITIIPAMTDAGLNQFKTFVSHLNKSKLSAEEKFVKLQSDLETKTFTRKFRRGLECALPQPTLINQLGRKIKPVHQKQYQQLQETLDQFVQKSISPEKKIVVKIQPPKEEDTGLLSVMVAPAVVKKPKRQRNQKGQYVPITIKINPQTTEKSDLAPVEVMQDQNEVIEKKVEQNSGSYASGSQKPNELGFVAPEAQDQEPEQDQTKVSKSESQVEPKDD